MNPCKRLYCRTFQMVFRIALPLLPYRDPKLLDTREAIVQTLRNKEIASVLLVTDRGIRDVGLTTALERDIAAAGIALTVYDGTVANPTTDNVAACLQQYRDNACTAIVAVGGGSAMDCAKATGALSVRPKKTLGQMKGILRVRKKLPLLIAVPTTAGTGSETTLAAVITDGTTRHKYAINDFPLIPAYAALLPELTVGLPKHLTATTGMDALTHAIEAYLGRSTTRQTRRCALSAVKTVFENLPAAYADGTNLQARENMLNASFQAGIAFSKSYVGYVHAVAHSLGGKYDVPHGLANAVLLPVVLKKYGKKIFRKLWKLGVYAGLFDRSTPPPVGAKIFIEHIEDMNAAMDIPKAFGCIVPADIPALARTAEKEANPLYPVPKLWTAAQLETIYKEVCHG